jgi:putative tryptophan/tyrosine transport system substrate-binding protein
VQLQPVEVRAPHEFTSAFAAMSSERASALMLLADSMFGSHRAQVVDLAAKSHLPSMFWVKDFVAAGGLMSYGASYPDLLRRAATYVDKILKGAKPADLPVEQPTKFELVINLKTAQALGLTIPPTLLFQADEVIR